MDFHSSHLLLFFLTISFSALFCSSFQWIDLENPQLSIKPVPIQLQGGEGNKYSLSCERVHVVPRSRLKLDGYGTSIRLTVLPSVVIPEKLHNRIQICLHGNASIEMCECEKDSWKSVQKGLWGSMISPYEDKYIDVKFVGDISGSVMVTVEEEIQRWRLICLVFGIILLLVAPIVSSWVPFYYSSTMVIGVLLVVLIILFQGMKLLPTGRKSAIYLTIYGSLLGAGSFLLHQFSMLVNSILVNFGLGEEMQNPVSIFLLVFIVLAGAGLGFWIVRRFVITDDGSVDVGIAQFVKWAMRIIASTFILQGTSDTLFAWGTLALCWLICSLISSLKWPDTGHMDWSPQWKKAAPRNNRAEFLRRSPKSSPQGKLLKSPNTAPNWSRSPIGGLTRASRRMNAPKQYYSTFHRMPKRKMSKKEWEEFTRESTQQAMAELTSSPEFRDWLIDNADRIQINDHDSSDESVGCGSDSTDVVDNGPRLGLFNW